MRIIVTGCNGKLGRAACEALVARGDEVIGVDAAAASGRPHRVVVGTLLDPFLVHRVFDAAGGPVDAVVHLANHTNSRVAPAEVVLRENMAMNSSVILGAFNAGVPRVVFSSSIQAMLPFIEMDGGVGEQRVPPGFPINEAIEPRPSNTYGLSKLLTERMLSELCRTDLFKGTMSAVSLRLPYILGPKEFDWVVARTEAAQAVWGGPEAFAYVAVEDAAAAVAGAVTAPIQGHEVIWCAAPDPRPIDTVAALVERFYTGVAGADQSVRSGSLQDCSKAKRLLDWHATKLLADERRRRGLIP